MVVAPKHVGAWRWINNQTRCRRWCISLCLNVFRASRPPSPADTPQSQASRETNPNKCTPNHLLQHGQVCRLLRAYTIPNILTHLLNQPHSNHPAPPRPATHTNPLHTLIYTDIKAIYTRNSQCYTGLFYSAVHHRCCQFCTILLMMGMMMPETCWDTNKYIIICI
jgi:hypothetical protein